jgi:hypothetical protein
MQIRFLLRLQKTIIMTAKERLQALSNKLIKSSQDSINSCTSQLNTLPDKLRVAHAELYLDLAKEIIEINKLIEC